MIDVHVNRQALYAKLRNTHPQILLPWLLAFGAYVEIAKLTHKASVLTLIYDSSLNGQIGYALAHLLDANFRVRIINLAKNESKNEIFHEIKNPLPCDLMLVCAQNFDSSIILQTKERARISVYLDGEIDGLSQKSLQAISDSKILCVGAPTLSLFANSHQTHEIIVAKILSRNSQIFSDIKLFYHAPKNIKHRHTICVLAAEEMPSGKSNFCAQSALRHGALEVSICSKNNLQKLPQISYTNAPLEANCYVCLQGASRAKKFKDAPHVLENPKNPSEIYESDIALFSHSGFLESGFINSENWLDDFVNLGQKVSSVLIGPRIFVASKDGLFIFDKPLEGDFNNSGAQFLSAQKRAELCGALAATLDFKRTDGILFAISNFKDYH